MTSPASPVCAVGAIVLNEGRILLVKRDREPSRGKWSLPGGRVELGETLQEALAREVKEETGLDVAVDGLAGTAEWIGRDDEAEIEHHFVILDFYATARSTELTPGDDAADARWVAMDELPDYQLSTGLIEFLGDRGIIARGRAPIVR